MKINLNNIEGYLQISKKLLPYPEKRLKNLYALRARPWGKNILQVCGKRVKDKDMFILDSNKIPKNKDFVHYEDRVSKLLIKKNICYLQCMSRLSMPPVIISYEELVDMKQGVVINVFQIPEII